VGYGKFDYTYKNGDQDYANVAVECEDCHEVLMDFDFDNHNVV